MTIQRVEHWNTGRSYSKHGQRITAVLLEDGRVLFHDHDRMIIGRLYGNFKDLTETLRVPVTSLYDRTLYDMPTSEESQMLAELPWRDQ
jgi:hypothetical protein